MHKKSISEVPKHRKKKQSSTSKARTKSKHRHRYKDCLFNINRDGIRHKGKYCTICGKVGDVDLFDLMRVSGTCWREMSQNEVYEKYKHLEQVEVEDFFQKFIVLRSGDNE